VPELEKKLGKLAHGGLIGSAHPATAEEVSRPEEIAAAAEAPKRLGKLAHGGLVGSAHPVSLKDLVELTGIEKIEGQ
jgi:hypothetical protein